MDTIRILFIKLSFLIIFSNFTFATTYTMGTTGSQSSTITAISGSPDKFYDNGGSGSNYSNNVSATYTFNCAAGSYVRIKVTLDTYNSNDLFYVYDGSTTSDRLIGEKSNYGLNNAYMYVATTGSLTVKFVTNNSNVSSGWDADVWIDNQPGQIWDGSVSTEITTASNWEGDVLPYDGFSSVYFPSGLTNYPVLSDASSQQMSFYDFRIPTGASYYFSSANNVMSIYGNTVVDGVFNKTSTLYVNFEGGNSSNYATISGSGNFTTVSVGVGLNRIAYVKISNSLLIKSFMLNNDIGASYFDMNGYDLRTLSFTVESGTTFYHRTGELKIEGSTISIDDASFVEATGTTNFTAGLDWGALNQTLPSIQYYNVKIRTNNGYTVTMGSGSTLTILNDLTIANPSTAGGIATNPNDVTVGGNFNLGVTGNALTLNIANRIYRASGTGVFTMGDVLGHAINNTYSSSSNYVISGFDATPTFYGTFTYNSSGSQKIIPANYYHFVSTGSGTKTMYGDITVNGNISFTNGTYTQGSYNMNIAGDWTSTGNYYSEGTGNVTFNGSSTSTITASSSTFGASSGISLLTESFENAGSIPTGWGTTLVTNVSTAPALTYVTTNTFPTVSAASAGSYMVKFNSYSATSGNQIRLKRSSGMSTVNYSNIVVNFDWYKDNTFSTSNDYVNVQYSTDGTTWTTAGSNITRYSATNGWTTQSITLPVGAENQSTLYIGLLFTSQYGSNCSLDNLSVTGDIAGTSYSGEGFNKVVINKTSGGVTLVSKILIQTSMTMTNGIMTSTASFYPEFDEDATVSGASNSSHVNGYVVKRTNTTTKFTFPVGNGTKYRLAAVSPSSTSSTSWTAKYFSSAYADLSLLDITHVSNVEYWTIDRSGAANSTVELSWDSSSGISSLTDLVVAHYNGSDWEDAGNSASSGTTSAGLISSTANWSSYSPFSLSVNTPTPLPIELIVFDGFKYKDNEVLLNWKTASEINNDYFTLERSFDGVHFSPLTRVNGAGNSTHEINYNFVDNDPVNGINYYKLIQSDFDGKETFTKVISVDMSKKLRSIVKTVNSIGQEVDGYYNGVVFDVYSDGTAEKRIQ